MEHGFDVLAEGCSANDDFYEVASECVLQFVAHFSEHALSQDGCVERKFHYWCLQLRQHGLAHDFLYDERHGHNEARFDVGESREKHCRRGRLGKEIDGHAVQELVDELEGHAVHVCHGEHGENLVAGFHILTQHAYGEVVVAPKCAEGNHDAFGVGGGAAGVVQDGQFVGRVAIVVDVVRAEIHGEFLAEETVEVLAGVFHFFGAPNEQFELLVGVAEDALEAGHAVGIELRPHLVAHKEELSLGVVHDVVNLLGVELVEDGHCNGSVGERGKECDAPPCAVAAADGNLVARFHARVFEYDVEFLDDARHVLVLECLQAIVAQAVDVPILLQALLHA